MRDRALGRLAGRVAFATWGSSGISRAVVRTVLADGTQMGVFGQQVVALADADPGSPRAPSATTAARSTRSISRPRATPLIGT